MTLRYSHLRPDTMRAAVLTLDRNIEVAAQQPPQIHVFGQTGG